MNVPTAGYLPGDRWLVVASCGLAYLDGTVTDALRMWRVLCEGAGARSAVDVLVRAAMQGPGGGLGRLQPFVLAIPEPPGLRVLCREIDRVAVRAAGDGGPAATVAGAGMVGWAETVVPYPCELTIGDAGPEGLLPVPGGVVRAAAVRWTPASAGEVAAAQEPAGGAPVAEEPAGGTAVAEEPAGGEVAVEDPAGEPAAPVAPCDQSRAADITEIPPLPEPEPLPALPPLPPFIPAPTVLPPIGPDSADRSIEETRFDVAVGADDGSLFGDLLGDLTGEGDGQQDAGDPVPGGGVDVPGDSVTALHPTAAADARPAPPAPPISAVPPVVAPPDAESGPGSGMAGRSGYADPGGDHDGLTQLAEDLPIGYTPPPAGEEMPPGTVLAVLCPSGHANAPHTSTCRLCGRPIDMIDPVPVQRPVLARIRLTSGEVVDLDRPVVLGRAPYASRVAASELPRLVTVPSPNQDISRAHAQIRAADWQLVVADLDSTNGTTVRPPGRAPLRLHPGQEIVVEPGWSVDLGDGVSFVVEAAP